MDYTAVIDQLAKNKNVIGNLLHGSPEAMYRWKQEPGKWSLLEIICHLCDEEQLDFRARVKHTLETPGEPMPAIDPPGWVTAHRYAGQAFEQKLNEFFHEREQSVQWLRELQNPQWLNAYQHPKFGAMTAKMFLSNWLAHDYLHIRQILKLRFDYLKENTGEDLSYAGAW